MTVCGGLGISRHAIAKPRPKNSTGYCYAMLQEKEDVKVHPKKYKAASAPVSFLSILVCIFRVHVLCYKCLIQFNSSNIVNISIFLDRFPDANVTHPGYEWYKNNNDSCGGGHYNPNYDICSCGEHCGWPGCRWKSAPATCLIGTNRTWAQKDSRNSQWLATSGNKLTL